MSDIRRHIEFPTIDIRVNRVLYESRELGMSCDDLRTTCTDLPTSYQDLLTSDKSYLRVMRSRGGKCIILALSKIEMDARSIFALLEKDQTLIFCTISDGPVVMEAPPKKKICSGGDTNNAKEVLSMQALVKKGIRKTIRDIFLKCIWDKNN